MFKKALIEKGVERIASISRSCQTRRCSSPILKWKKALFINEIVKKVTKLNLH